MGSVNWSASCIDAGGGCTGAGGGCVAGNVYSKGENGGCTGMGASSSTRFPLSFIPLLINQSLNGTDS